MSIFGILNAQENAWREMPYFLKGYEAEYKKSARDAALAWFEDARFGLFIHWGPATMYAKGEWVMYNHNIPLDEYVETARKFTGENIFLDGSPVTKKADIHLGIDACLIC